jgi:signal transduction histidine kinase
MNNSISDIELIQELKKRLEKNQSVMEEQKSLLLQLRMVNEKLIISESLKSNFLSNIRNEINNPIASVLELSRNISKGQLDQESMQKFGALVYGEAFNLDFQLRNIFLSAEIEAGEAVLSVTSINILSLINNVIDSFQHQFDKKGIELAKNFNFDPENNFHSDAEKLHLILSNLLSNAVQYTNSKGTVEIQGKIINKQLTISIADNGIGINNDHKNKIFDRFRQLDEGSTKTYGGHGLGLSITKALLEIVNGTVTLESQEGEGSTFTIAIPESEILSKNNNVVSLDGNDFLFNNDNKMFF